MSSDKEIAHSIAIYIKLQGDVMTEQQYKDLLIATAKMSDYEHKDEVVEALKVASVSL